MLELLKIKNQMKKQGITSCFLYSKVDSTNNVAKNLIYDGVVKDTSVIVSLKQTCGRGRYDRTFVSKALKGVYLTFVAKVPDSSPLATFGGVCALSVTRTLFELYGLQSTIKWPNDVKVNGKKICGILPESVLDGNGQRYYVIGIGVNVNYSAKELCKIDKPVTSVKIEKGKKVDLVNAVVTLANNISLLFDQYQSNYLSLVKQFASNCETIGKEISFVVDGIEQKGKVENIDDLCSLIVTTDNGRVTINYGEIIYQ